MRVLPKDSPVVTLGERLRKARKERGLTQAALAEPEFSKGYVSAIERGAVRPSLKALDIFARRLGVPRTDLLKATPEGLIEPELEALQEDLQYVFNYTRMLIHQNQPEQALQLIADAERRASLFMDRLPAGVRYNIPLLRGLAYMQQARPDLAKPELEAALAAASPDEEAIATARNLLGVVCYHLEQPQLALEHHLQALRAVHSGVVKDPGLKLSIYRNLAGDYWALNDLTRAINVYREAEAILQDFNDARRQANLLWELATAYRAEGSWHRARLYASRALHIYEATEDRAKAASINMNLAGFLLGEHKYDEAQKLLEQAEQRLSGTGDYVLLSVLYQYYAELTRSRGQLDRAAEYVTRSISLSEEAIRQAAGQQGEQEQAAGPLNQPHAEALRAHAEALRTAALVEESRGNREAADRLFQQAIDLINRTGFEDSIYAITFSYADVLKTRGEFEKAVEYYRIAAQTRPRSTHPGI